MKKRYLRLLLVTNALVAIAGTMVAPIYALFVENISDNVLWVGVAWAIFSFSAAISGWITGKYSDKRNVTKRFIVLGYLIIGTSFVLYNFINSVWMLLFTQLLTGIGEGMYAPVLDKEYAANTVEGEEGSQWANLEGMYYVIDGFGALFGSLIVVYFNFNVLFSVMAGICFLGALIYINFTNNQK